MRVWLQLCFDCVSMAWKINLKRHSRLGTKDPLREDLLTFHDIGLAGLVEGRPSPAAPRELSPKRPRTPKSATPVPPREEGVVPM